MTLIFCCSSDDTFRDVTAWVDMEITKDFLTSWFDGFVHYMTLTVTFCLSYQDSTSLLFYRPLLFGFVILLLQKVPNFNMSIGHCFWYRIISVLMCTYFTNVSSSLLDALIGGPLPASFFPRLANQMPNPVPPNVTAESFIRSEVSECYVESSYEWNQGIEVREVQKHTICAPTFWPKMV